MIKPIFSSKSLYHLRVINLRRGDIKGAWCLGDAAGPTALNLAQLSYNGENLDNPGLEAGYANVGYQVGTGAIADEATLVHSGSNAVKLTAGSSTNTYLFFCVKLDPGSSYSLTFWTRGDGTNSGRFGIKNLQTGDWIKSLTSNGVSGTTYTQVTWNFTMPATCSVAMVYLYCPSTNGGICYYDDVSISGSALLDGGYGIPAQTTYGATGFDGRKAVTLAGVTGQFSAIQVGNSAFNSIWNGNIGSAICWGKVAGASVWTDATVMRYFFHVKSERDITVYIAFGKDNSASHQLAWLRRAAGAPYKKTYTFDPAGTLDWFCMGMIWDVVSVPKRIAGFLYTKEDQTFQKVFDEAPASGNEAWGSNPVRSSAACLGGGTNATQLWQGSLQYCFFWAGVVLSDAEMQKVMRL